MSFFLLGSGTEDAAAAGLSVLQSPSLSEALGMDPSALEPSQILDQRLPCFSLLCGRDRDGCKMCRHW